MASSAMIGTRSRASSASVNLLVRSPILHTASVSTPVKAPGPDTRMKISPYTRKGTERITMITRLKRKDTGAGTGNVWYLEKPAVQIQWLRLPFQ